jgi:hypothetical protein
MEIALFILVLIALDIAANRWGISSIDGPDSPEWSVDSAGMDFTNVRLDSE